MARKTFPRWAFKPDVLKGMAKYRNLKCKGGGLFRIVFFNFELPVGEVWARPHLLRYEADVDLMFGRFQLERPKSGEQLWYVLQYSRPLEGFFCDLQGQNLDIVTGDPKAIYYDDQQRDEQNAKLLGVTNGQEVK